MFDLPETIPTSEMLLNLEPEELGAKLLFLIQDRKKGAYQHRGMFQIEELQQELWGRPQCERPGYPDDQHHAVSVALREAWSWLEAQGFIVPDPQGAQAGLKRLSRRGRKIQDEAAMGSFVSARRMPKEILHPAMRQRVWSAMIRGEYDIAAFQAMKSVEVAVRAASGLGGEWIGVKLMREAFKAEGGLLTDISAEKGERVARMDLFAGAIGSYKNPHSHRDVAVDDPQEAMEIVLLANHLLRIVDARAAARAA